MSIFHHLGPMTISEVTSSEEAVIAQLGSDSKMKKSVQGSWDIPCMEHDILRGREEFQLLD